MTTVSNILVINCGSSSLKYKVFSAQSFALVHKGGIEQIGELGSVYPNHESAIEGMFTDLESNNIAKSTISGVGHRVVHGFPPARRCRGGHRRLEVHHR